MNGPVGQLEMPDGTLLVSSWNNSLIFRYDAATGALLGTFNQGGPLNHPNNMALLNIPEPTGLVALASLLLVAVRRRARFGNRV